MLRRLACSSEGDLGSGAPLRRCSARRSKQRQKLLLILFAWSVSVVLVKIVAVAARRVEGGSQICAHSIDEPRDQVVRRARRSAPHRDRLRARPMAGGQRNNRQDRNMMDGRGRLASSSLQAALPGSETRIDCSRDMVNTDGCSSPVKTIETSVFIDQALESKFDGLSGGLAELNKLVMTIMNQVQHIFRYSTMKVPIRIKLVLVEFLRDSDRYGLTPPSPAQGDIDAYLSNFCNWQFSRLEREKRLWWDHAILLSGLDLYKASSSKNHSGVLGLAWVGGMCKGNYSCTINEASNLESAFVIAHEVGHSLGIMHDGQRNTCDPNSFLMSEKTGAGKVHWSRCSNHYLEDSIHRRQLTCLEAERTLSSDSIYDLAKLRAPGQVYTINDQCKLAFGGNYTSFVTRQQPFNSVCRELWCVSGTWAKAAHPALEGSSCGELGRVCREGKCVPETVSK